MKENEKKEKRGKRKRKRWRKKKRKGIRNIESKRKVLEYEEGKNGR